MAFTTAEEVFQQTGYQVTAHQVHQAQIMIESYVGKSEFDVTDSRDLELLRNATSYQAAYISKNVTGIFEQMKVAQEGIAGSVITFRAGDNASPYISGMAQLACKNLSWLKSRSVRTAPIFRKPLVLEWERN